MSAQGPPGAADPPGDPRSPDLDLRVVRYFTAVAEHQNFSRAAQALHTTQPSLSRQVRRLERDLGARLLQRTAQGSRLTEAGRAFLPRATALLEAAASAAAHVRSLGHPDRVTVGFTSTLIVTPAVRHLRHRRPDADVRTRHLAWDDARPALLSARVDAVVTRWPAPLDGLHLVPLHDEPRVVVLPRDHRLAGEESVALADIADEPVPRVHDDAWNAVWRVDPRPDGRPAPDGPLVADVEDKYELVASGQAVAIAAATSAVPRPDLTTVPLDDVEPSHVVLLTRADDRSELVAEFTRAARAHLTGPLPPSAPRPLPGGAR